MFSPPVIYTLKRSRAGKHIDKMKLPSCEIREIRNNVEFSDLFEQLLEKRSNYMKKKLSLNLKKDKDTRISVIQKKGTKILTVGKMNSM